MRQTYKTLARNTGRHTSTVDVVVAQAGITVVIWVVVVVVARTVGTPVERTVAVIATITTSISEDDKTKSTNITKFC